MFIDVRDTFLLPDGCPVDDPLVQRFYRLCLETRGEDTLCRYCTVLYCTVLYCTVLYCTVL